MSSCDERPPGLAGLFFSLSVFAAMFASSEVRTAGCRSPIDGPLGVVIDGKPATVFVAASLRWKSGGPMIRRVGMRYCLHPVLLAALLLAGCNAQLPDGASRQSPAPGEGGTARAAAFVD